MVYTSCVSFVLVLHSGLRRSSSEQHSIIFVACSANPLSPRLAAIIFSAWYSPLLSSYRRPIIICNATPSPSVLFDDVGVMFLFGADDAKTRKKDFALMTSYQRCVSHSGACSLVLGSLLAWLGTARRQWE